MPELTPIERMILGQALYVRAVHADGNEIQLIVNVAVRLGVLAELHRQWAACEWLNQAMASQETQGAEQPRRKPWSPAGVEAKVEEYRPGPGGS